MKITWIPGHEGLQLNEEADQAAKASLIEIKTIRAPLPGQVPIPLQIAAGMIQRAQRTRDNQVWLKLGREKTSQGIEHLSRILPELTKRPPFLQGPQRTQATITRLRTAHCGLKESRARVRRKRGGVCDCKFEEETVEHFLLRCPRLAIARIEMLEKIWQVVPYGTRMSEQLILGKLGKGQVEVVHTAIHEFVMKTKPSFLK